MPPTGSYVQFNQTVIRFEVDIPDEYIVENFFVSKLFEFIEFKLNHVAIQSKSSANDNIISNFMQHRMNYADGVFNNMGPLEGYWSTKSLNSSELYTLDQPTSPPDIGQTRRGHPEVSLRQMGAYKNAVTGKWRYCFISKINFPFAKTRHPLPRECPFQLIFHRATSNKALLSVKLDNDGNDIGGFTEHSIPLLNPVLVLALANSSYYDSKYSTHKLPRLNWPFTQNVVRRDTLLEGVAYHKVKISDGPLPSAICFSFMRPEAWEGSYTGTITHFNPQNIERFDLQLNAKSLPGYPLELNNYSAHNFFYHFNKTCNFWDNPLTLGGVNYQSFINGNFIVVEDLKNKGYDDGQFCLSLKFKEVLPRNLLLVMLIIKQKSLQIDEFLNCSVHNLELSKADKEADKLGS